MRSGFSYLASELKYKTKLDWLGTTISFLGIVFASVNLFNGNAWIFLLLGGLNFTILVLSLLSSYRYLPRSPLMMLNLYGAVANYTDFKRQQEVLLAEIFALDAKIGRKSVMNYQRWNMIDLEGLTSIRNLGLLILRTVD